MITIHILPNISRSKSNQAMEIGRLINYREQKMKQGDQVRVFLFFKNDFYKGKAIVQHLGFNKDGSIDKIDHECLFYCSKLVFNSCFLDS